MPYTWKENQTHIQELTLWPHQSLPPKGFAIFMLSAFILAIIPLLGLLGTVLLWGILPFMLIALWGMWFALRRNDKDRQIVEILRLTHEDLSLTRHNPRGPDQSWSCNPYWVRVNLHAKGGPVPNYVTLSGHDREVEIGAFLGEDERKALYGELCDKIRHFAQA